MSMSWQLSFRLFFLLIFTFVSMTLAVYSSRRRQVKGALPLALLLAAAGAWLLGLLIVAGIANASGLTWGTKVAYLGIVAVPPAWLWFAFQYTDGNGRLTRRHLILITLVPLVTLLLAWTNEWHGLLWLPTSLESENPFGGEAHGLWFWLHLLFFYALLLAGTVRLWQAKFHGRLQQTSHWSTGLLLAGLLVPWLAHLLAVLEIAVFDLMPAGFVVAGGLFACDLFVWQGQATLPKPAPPQEAEAAVPTPGSDAAGRPRLHHSERQLIPYKVLRAIGESLEPQIVAYTAVETVANLTEWPAVALSMPDETGRLVTRASVGVLYMDEGINGRVFRTGRLHHIPDLSQEPNQVYDIARSLLAVPLQRGRDCLGVFNVECDHPNAFTEDDIVLAESLAEVSILALDNARLHAETEKQLREQKALREAVTIISSTLDLPTVLTHIAQQMGRVIDATCVYICSYEPASATSAILAEYYDPQQQEPEPVYFLGTLYYLPQDFPDIMTSLESGEPTVAYVDNPTLPQSRRVHMQAVGAQTILVIPLRIAGQTIAYAELWDSRYQQEFTPEDIALCQGIAQQAAVAIENARLFQLMEEERGRLQALIESTYNGIILIGLDGNVLVMNPPAQEFLGLATPPEEWVGRPVLEVLSHLRHRYPDLVRSALAELRRLERGETMAGEGEFEIPPRIIHWRNLPVMAKEVLVGRLLVLRDVTEERSLEKMREDLIHTMVHDLRNPLTSISVSLDLFGFYTGDLLDDRAKRALNRARNSTVKMLELVNAILDISRLENLRLSLSEKPVSLATIMETVFEAQQPLARDKEIHLDQDVDGTLPPVSADAALVERVLQNLVGNAIKFTPAEGKVCVKAGVDTADDSRLLVTVSDTGPGIPPEIRPYLFQKFVTGEQEERGSGLGLAFCKMAIEAHGERIWLGNTSQQGTTFYFTLPLATTNSKQKKPS